MRQLQLPKTLLTYRYVTIEGEFDTFRLILPNGHSYVVDIEELFDYLMSDFKDEEFVDRVLAGVTNFKRVQLLPKQKHYYHIPKAEESYE